MEQIDQEKSASGLDTNTTPTNTQKAIFNSLDSFNLHLPDWILSKMDFPESHSVATIPPESNISKKYINGYQKVISTKANEYSPLGSYREGSFKQGELHGYGVWAYNHCIRIGEFNNAAFRRGIYIRYDDKGNIKQLAIGEGTGDYPRGLAMLQEGRKTEVGYFHTGLEIGRTNDELRGEISKAEYTILKEYLQGFSHPGSVLPPETLEVTNLRDILKKRAFFDNIHGEIEHMQKEGYIDNNIVNLHRQLHNNDPLRAKLLFPILLDPRFDTKAKAEDQLNCIMGDSETREWIEENNILEGYGFSDTIRFYVSKYMTYDFVRGLSETNPELFRRLYPIFGEQYIADNYHNSLEKFQDIGITPIESSAFFQRTGSGDFHRFLEPRHMWQRAMFANLVEKLPSTKENVYRGIRFRSEQERSSFLENLDGINNVIANFSLKESIAKKFSSGGNPKEFGVILSVHNVIVHHLDGEFMDLEQHAWFEEGTQFRIKNIIQSEPVQVELEIII